jgi:hypothetical protein
MSVSAQWAVDDICFQIARLDEVGQQEVFERIENLKTEKQIPPSKPIVSSGSAFRISDLWGVGSEIWQGENVNEYIRKERDSWD